MKYSEIVGVEEHFKSAFDITSDFGDSWKTFISNDKFENNMGQIIKSFTSPVFNNRKSIWVQGTYGTGKSHSLAVIEHLLCDEYENIEDYLPRINKAQIRNEIANFRKEKKVFPVVLKGIYAITDVADLTYIIQQQVAAALRDKNIDIATKTDFQSVIQIIKRGDLDSFFENLINKNINKSESVSESDRRLKIKNLFAREKSVWMIGEVLEVLVFFGLDEKALARWRSRNPENQNFILELAAGGMSRFDYDTIAQVFARCQAAKDKEGKPLSSAVAFVLKSLQHELTAVSNRKNARQSASESAQPKRFRDIDYMEGIERLNPDGTFVLKRKTEGR